jgi:hypothetical protein
VRVQIAAQATNMGQCPVLLLVVVVGDTRREDIITISRE